VTASHFGYVALLRVNTWTSVRVLGSISMSMASKRVSRRLNAACGIEPPESCLTALNPPVQVLVEQVVFQHFTGITF